MTEEEKKASDSEDKSEEVEEKKKECDCGDSTENEDGVCDTCKVTDDVDEKKEASIEESDPLAKLDNGKKPQLSWIIITLLLMVALVASIATQGFSTIMPQDKIIPENPGMSEVIAKTVAYINTSVLPAGTNMRYVGAEDIDGVYKFTVEVDGNEFESYVTKSGKLIFPQGMVVEEPCSNQCGNGVCQEGAPDSVCLETNQTCPADCRGLEVEE